MHHDQSTTNGQYIDLNEVATRLSVSRRQAELMLSRGEIPAPVRIGRLRKWHSALLNEWMLDQARRATGSR